MNRKSRPSSPPPPPLPLSSSSSSSSSLPNNNHLKFISHMARKPSVIKQTLILSVLFLLSIYAFVNAYFTPSSSSDDNKAGITTSLSLSRNMEDIAETKVRVYMYDLPRKFTYGMIEQHAIARGRSPSTTPVADVSTLKYPGHQHMGEWYLFSDLNRSESDRVGFGSPIVKVTDPEEADLFFVPVFSSLSLIVNTGSSSSSAAAERYSDEEMQEELVEWLGTQEYWRRNKGWDHVIIAGDPNAMLKVIDKIKNAVLLLSDFGRLRHDQGSLVKDVIIPYSHRISTYKGDLGVKNRNTLLFFMGNRYRKEGGKIRDLLFNLLESEEDVVIKHGTQSRENRRAATQGMHTSKFCLNPAGDTPSACRLFDSIVSLCVPVIVSDDIELPFEDVIDYRKIAVFVETAVALKPGFLASTLRSVSEERIVEYQKQMLEVQRYFIYNHPNGTVNAIWHEVSQKLPLIKLMINRDKRLVRREQPSKTDCSALCTNQTGIVSSL